MALSDPGAFVQSPMVRFWLLLSLTELHLDCCLDTPRSIPSPPRLYVRCFRTRIRAAALPVHEDRGVQLQQWQHHQQATNESPSVVLQRVCKIRNEQGTGSRFRALLPAWTLPGSMRTCRLIFMSHAVSR